MRATPSLSRRRTDLSLSPCASEEERYGWARNPARLVGPGPEPVLHSKKTGSDRETRDRILNFLDSARLAPSSTVNSMILRSLRDNYLEVSKMTPPPKIKGALDSGGPVLTRKFENEEINISVMRMADIVPGGSGDDYSDDSLDQLFLYVDISKPGPKESLHFLCGLYPDALGIHSVSLRPKSESSGFMVVPSKYNGPVFEVSRHFGKVGP